MIPPKVCAVIDCSRKAQCSVDSARVCLMHYKRWIRNGDFGSAEARPAKRDARGICCVKDCGAVDDGPHGYCKKHMTRVRRHGDPQTVLPTGPPAGPNHHSRNDAGLTYSGAHLRIRAVRGSARDQLCVDCSRPALQWSYDRRDPAERTSDFGPYSIDPSHYVPRCVPCHKAFDLGALRGAS